MIKSRRIIEKQIKSGVENYFFLSSSFKIKRWLLNLASSCVYKYMKRNEENANEMNGQWRMYELKQVLLSLILFIIMFIVVVVVRHLVGLHVKELLKEDVQYQFYFFSVNNPSPYVLMHLLLFLLFIFFWVP